MNFRIRCSAIGKIMTGEIGLTEIQEARIIELSERANGNGKPLTPNMEQEFAKLKYKQENPELPSGAKSYCEEWLLSKQYNRDREWSNKFVEKGLRVEDLAIDLLSRWFNEGVQLQKNEQFFQNEFMHGTPDVIHDGIVYDTKCPWDLFKFPWFETEIPNKEYYWQLQGYMALTGHKKAALAYCLIDTPQPLVDQELKKLYYQTGGIAEDWTPEKYEELYENYRFSDIDIDKRIRVFDVLRNDADIEKIYERVELCRKYISSLIPVLS